MPTTDHSDGRLYLRDVAGLLEPRRKMNTIRKWAAQDLLPDELMPYREGGRRTIYWLPDQIQGLLEFARAREARRGWSNLHQSRQGEST